MECSGQWLIAELASITDLEARRTGSGRLRQRKSEELGAGRYSLRRKTPLARSQDRGIDGQVLPVEPEKRQLLLELDIDGDDAAKGRRPGEDGEVERISPRLGRVRKQEIRRGRSRRLEQKGRAHQSTNGGADPPVRSRPPGRPA